jgi:hypothetical protein
MRSPSFSPVPPGQQPGSSEDANRIKRTPAAKIDAGFVGQCGDLRDARWECVELQRLSG